MKINTYLHFDGNCREAMSFYQKCLGGEAQFNSYPDANGNPATDPNAKVMHSQITLDGGPLLMASDTSPMGPVHPGNNFSISVDCQTAEELDRLFKSIGENGQIRLAPMDAPWGARFGMLTDQFGIQWMFNCARSK